MTRIKFEFERGGILYGTLNRDKAPLTVQSVIEALPVETDLMHTRWCGREFSFSLTTRERPPRENTTGTISKFEICYWRSWESEAPLPEAPGAEALAIYYGAERPSYHDGLLSLCVIGHIDYDQEKLLEEIGERIWKHGTEKVRASLVEE